VRVHLWSPLSDVSPFIAGLLEVIFKGAQPTVAIKATSFDSKSSWQKATWTHLTDPKSHDQSGVFTINILGIIVFVAIFCREQQLLVDFAQTSGVEVQEDEEEIMDFTNETEEEELKRLEDGLAVLASTGCLTSIHDALPNSSAKKLAEDYEKDFGVIPEYLQILMKKEQ